MRKIILSVIALLSINFTNAQSKIEGFSKGSIYASGSFGINYTSDKKVPTTSMDNNFSPSLGYFVTSNLAIGTKVNFGWLTTPGNDGGALYEVKSIKRGIGVFGRYYFTPANRFSLITNLGVDYNSTKPNKDSALKINEFSINVTPGINYFISNHFALEAGFGRLGYSSSKTNVYGVEPTREFGLDLDLSTISFGLTFKF